MIIQVHVDYFYLAHTLFSRFIFFCLFARIWIHN